MCLRGGDGQLNTVTATATGRHILRRISSAPGRSLR